MPVSGGSPRPEPAASLTNTQDGCDANEIMAMARRPPPGSSVYSPTAIPSGALNPRSCVTCRRRKVRCDKHMPCSNCRRAQIPCIFPPPGRAPRRPRPKDPNAPAKQPVSEREAELLNRLHKLEGIVHELSGQIEVESVRHPYSAGNSPEAGLAYARDDHAIGTRLMGGPHAAGGSGGGGGGGGGGGSQGSPSSGSGLAGLPARPGSGTMSEPDATRISSSPDVHKQFGRLVLNEKGVTRYVSSVLWSNINDEVTTALSPASAPWNPSPLLTLRKLADLKKASQNLTDEDSDESDLDATPESVDNDKSLTNHQSFIFGYRSADVDLRPLHPLPSQIPFIWQVYQENVDPILKVIHVPTMSKVIKDLRNNMDSLTPSTEALMFSIYYASITSLDEEEVRVFPPCPCLRHPQSADAPCRSR